MGMKLGRTVPTVILALLTLLVLPYRGTALAQTPATGGGDLLSNPFILHNSVTGATAAIMPTTSYLANHETAAGTNAGTGSTNTSSSLNLPSPTCTLATDSSAGDAHVLVNTADTQFDSLDVSAFGLSSDSSSVTGQLSVQSLGDGAPVGGTPAPATPTVAGGGDIWYVTWNYGSDPSIKGYFLEVQYPGKCNTPAIRPMPAT